MFVVSKSDINMTKYIENYISTRSEVIDSGGFKVFVKTFARHCLHTIPFIGDPLLHIQRMAPKGVGCVLKVQDDPAFAPAFARSSSASIS